NPYRVMWVPAQSTWSFYSLRNPRVNSNSLIDKEWKVFFERADESLNTGERLIDLLNEPYALHLLSISSIRYVAIPLQDDTHLESRLFEYYGEEREFYIEELDKLDYLEKADLGTGDLIIYENENQRSRVYTTQ